MDTIMNPYYSDLILLLLVVGTVVEKVSKVLYVLQMLWRGLRAIAALFQREKPKTTAQAPPKTTAQAPPKTTAQAPPKTTAPLVLRVGIFTAVVSAPVIIMIVLVALNS